VSAAFGGIAVLDTFVLVRNSECRHRFSVAVAAELTVASAGVLGCVVVRKIARLMAFATASAPPAAPSPPPAFAALAVAAIAERAIGGLAGLGRRSVHVSDALVLVDLLDSVLDVVFGLG